MAAMHGRPTSSGRSFRLLLVCAAVAYGPCAGRSILRCGARRDHNLSSAGENRTVGSSHAPIFELSEPRPAFVGAPRISNFVEGTPLTMADDQIPAAYLYLHQMDDNDLQLYIHRLAKEIGRASCRERVCRYV